MRPPMGGYRFIAAKNLFDDHVDMRQALKITVGIQKTVDVVDAQSVHKSIVDETKNGFVCCLEHVVAFGSDPDKFIDVEESPVVDRVRGFPPKREAVGLRGDQAVEIVDGGNLRR